MASVGVGGLGGPLTAPGTASAASGAGSGTSRRCAPASGRRAARGEGRGGQASAARAGGAGPGRGHAPRSQASRGSPAPAGPRSRPSGSGGCLAAACGEWSLRPAESPPAVPRPPGPPRAHLHQQRAATARAAAPATEHATTSTAGRGRGEGGLSGGTLSPAHRDLRTYRPTEGESVTAPAPGLQGGHVHRHRRHRGAQGGVGRGCRGSPSGGGAQVRALAAL